ncbi:MAG: spore coat protein [Candidatus Moraniibacteriota bacterium]|nr:MAG: spore coat protein [Candidatus Moranbacteria bacterium]
MKGVILAGGNATRMYPNTARTSKQMLPIYKVPMIFYPLNILIKANIKDIYIITTPTFAGSFISMLEPMFRDFGIRFSMGVQEIPRGIPDAFIIAESFIADDNVTLILGDNIFVDTDTIANAIKNFTGGGHIFAKQVPDPQRFGVATVAEGGVVTNIVEKPEKPKSNFAITGAYIYDNRAVNVAHNLKPSARKELEIVDLHNFYLQKGALQFSEISGDWIDAGTEDSYLDACNMARDLHLYEAFDPIIKEAIESGYARYKSLSKRALKN